MAHITPDDFDGIDREKVAAAVKLARDTGVRIRFDRDYDLGDGPVSAAATAAAAGSLVGGYGYGVEYGPCGSGPERPRTPSTPTRRERAVAALKEARFRIREAWLILRNGVDIY